MLNKIICYFKKCINTNEYIIHCKKIKSNCNTSNLKESTTLENLAKKFSMSKFDIMKIQNALTTCDVIQFKLKLTKNYNNINCNVQLCNFNDNNTCNLNKCNYDEYRCNLNTKKKCRFNPNIVCNKYPPCNNFNNLNKNKPYNSHFNCVNGNNFAPISKFNSMKNENIDCNDSVTTYDTDSDCKSASNDDIFDIKSGQKIFYKDSMTINSCNDDSMTINNFNDSDISDDNSLTSKNTKKKSESDRKFNNYYVIKGNNKVILQTGKFGRINNQSSEKEDYFLRSNKDRQYRKSIKCYKKDLDSNRNCKKKIKRKKKCYLTNNKDKCNFEKSSNSEKSKNNKIFNCSSSDSKIFNCSSSDKIRS